MTIPGPLPKTLLGTADLLANHPWRQGNVINVPAEKEIIVSGDLHGNRNNLHAILEYADLSVHPERVLILQEIIHGQEDPATGHDRSFEPFMRALRAMSQHPQQVLMVMGNHDLAQITDKEITKHGRGSCKAFNAGVLYEFEDQGPEILDALSKFLYCLPLAVRSPGGVFFTHSLPAPNRMRPEMLEILQRESDPEDLVRPGPVYEWTWGRNQTPEQIDRLAEQLGVSFFVLGHKHVSQGWEELSDKAVILNSSDSRGCILQIASDQGLESAGAVSHIHRIHGLISGDLAT